MQPIKVHVIPAGPNPWKPVLVLEELGVPYEINAFRFKDVKRKPFININPNGRAPAIEDPNTGITLWESGAIVQYIIEQYDTKHQLSYDSLKERHLCNQWLAFQISGQGPYFGQAGWFNQLHPEKIPSAITRYNNELKRVLGVLNGALEGRQWLVGDKLTFADLSFTNWNDRIDMLIMVSPDKKFEGFPNVQAWHERITSRPAWKATMEKRNRVMDEQGLQPSGIPKGINSFPEYLATVKAYNEKAAAEEA